MISKIPPYHLRLNKAVDRFLLIDILRCFTKHELSHYLYAGLGGPFLEDFKLLDTFFPTLKKVSYETEPQVFIRQQFNRPSRLIHLFLGDLIQGIEEQQKRHNGPFVVWYDSTSSFYDTFEGFMSLLGSVPNNSIIRVTTRLERLTPTNRSLIDSLTQSLKARVQASGISMDEQQTLGDDIERIVREQIEQTHPQRSELSRISRFLPTDYLKIALGKNGMAKLIFGAFHQAATEVFPPNSGHVFRLLNASQYSDGTKMLSITGALLSASEERSFMRRFSKTSFATAAWTDDPMQIDMPILTPKERLHLNKRLPVINNPGERLIKRLGFSIDPTPATCIHEMEMYNRFFRYYPVFAKVSL